MEDLQLINTMQDMSNVYTADSIITSLFLN
jgi:hypothetical protein